MRIKPHKFLCQLFDKRRRQHPRSNGYFLRYAAWHGVRLPKRFPKLIQQQAQHPHAVFQLHISVIAFFRRQLLIRKQIPFVRRMDEMRAVLLHTRMLPSVDQPYHIRGFLLRKRLQRIQPVPVFCQPRGNDRQAFHMREISSQLPNTKIQLFAVIDTFAEHNLPVHLDSRFVQAPHLFQRVTRKTVVQHLAAQLLVHRLHRNINWRQLIRNDPLDIRLF